MCESVYFLSRVKRKQSNCIHFRCFHDLNNQLNFPKSIISREDFEDLQREWLKQAEKWEEKHMGNYRRIYPAPGCEKYDRFYNTTGTLFSETAASRARLEQAK